MTAPPLAPAATVAVDWPALAAELDGVLRRALALDDVPPAPALAGAAGSWKGAPATIETRASHGERVSYCRAARVRGTGLAIGNVLCVPDPRLRTAGTPLPILGVDLVAIGERDAIVVADLSPTGDDPTSADGWMAAALDADPRAAALAPIADLPRWARESFSRRALAVRVPLAHRPVAAEAVRRVVDAFVALVRDARVDGSAEAACAVRHDQQRYMERHRDEDGGLALLARIFGNEWARGYIRDVLFPDLPESP
ncbi:MAG TPA: hypothetical protein VF761_03050 [Gemmatimonadaceae bacterium]